MGITRDYILQQIQLFIQLMLSRLLGKTIDEPEYKLDLVLQAYKLLDLDPKTLYPCTIETLLEHFAEDPLKWAKMELLAYSVFEEYRLGGLSKSWLDYATELLAYIDEHSDTYSMDRKYVIQRMKSQA